MKLFDIILEDGELDERVAKPDEEWIDLFKKKYPQWNYDNAKVYFKGRKKIKNIYCTIHDLYFPEKGQAEIDVNAHDGRGTGCRQCGIEGKQANKRKTVQQWREDLNNVEQFKNKCDFSKATITFTDPPTTYGPLVSNVYCKIHKKYFTPGARTEGGVRGLKIYSRTNICPECIKQAEIDNRTKSREEWIKEFKNNKRNKNYDYSKIILKSEQRGLDPNKRTFVYNISCNVKGLDGKKHGIYDTNGVSANEHKRGRVQCPKCECENKQINFLKNALEMHGDTYVYDKVDFCDPNTIVNGIRKVLIGCKVTGHGYFFQNPYLHGVLGNGCPICRSSKGEDYVLGLLQSKFGSKYKIERETNLGFKELGNKLFDFYIPELKVVIEYDGEGHFWPIFGSSEYGRNLSYNRVFESDNLKNAIIRGKKTNPNGIRLIRIPYTMEFEEIKKPLMDAIKNAPPNQITYIGEYPRRHNRKEAVSKFKLNEFKLSLIDILKS